MEKQTPISIGKSLGPKPPQPEPQQQQYQLLKKHGKTSRCNGCHCEFDKGDSTSHILGRSEYDWFIHVNRKENIKVFKLSRQNRYYCVQKQCILARRPLLNIKSMHVACVRKDVCKSICNYVESYFEISIEYNWYKIWFGWKVKKRISYWKIVLDVQWLAFYVSKNRLLFPIYL